MNRTQFATTLQSHGYSLTAPRLRIYEFLSSSEPVTMQQLSSALPKINRASVYRTIALFEQLGIVQRLQMGWKYTLELSNEYQDHHHHFTCLQCGTITPLPEDVQLEKRLQHITKQQGAIAQDHQIEIRGVCAQCQKT